MKKVFLLFGLLAMVGVLFMACSDKDPTGPDEASFKKETPTECLEQDQQDLKEDIDTEIEELFNDRKSKRGAHEIVNNMVRKLCKDQYDDATNMAWDFFYLVWRQMPDKLTGGPTQAGELTQMVFTFASDPLGDPPLEIPDGAFEESGGVIRFDPTTATAEDPIVAATTNGQAAVVIDNPNAFPPGTDMVTIALSRESDDDVTEPGEFITGFQAYPIGIQVLSDVDPDPNGGGLLLALCVLDGAPANVVIGHQHNGDVELLVPTDPDPEYLEYIDCTGATGNTVIELVEGPRWMQVASRLLEPVVKLFEPKPLNAVMFAGRGLGGRTNKLSLDAAVDPTIYVGETVQLSVGDPTATWVSGNPAVATVDANTGLVTGIAAGTAIMTATFGEGETLDMTVTVEAIPVVLPHTLAFSRGQDAATEIYTLDESLALVQLTDNASLDFLPGWSPDGGQIVFSSERTGDFDIWIMNADGSGPHNLTLSPASQETGPDWSEVGGKVAFSSFTTSPVERDIWVMNADGTGATGLTSNTDDDAGASWSPDGTKIAFFSDRDGDYDIYVMNNDGTGVVQLTDDPQMDVTPDWSPDGTQIAFTRLTPGSNGDVWVMNPDGTGQANLTNSATLAYGPAWSPDGLQIAFENFPDAGVNSSDLWIMAADGSGQVGVLVGPEDDRSPAWRPAAGPSLACYPGLPDPVLVFDSVKTSAYFMRITNYASFPDAIFTLTPDYGPCGGNPTPSRTWLRFHNASGGVYYTQCGYEESADLTDVRSILGAYPTVYITLEDRACAQTYTSNTIAVPPPPPPPSTFLLTVTGAGLGAGSITGTGINCQWNGSVNTGDCTETFPTGTVVLLTASPGSFSSWSPNCTGGDAVNTCLVTMDLAKTVTATF